MHLNLKIVIMSLDNIVEIPVAHTYTHINCQYGSRKEFTFS